MEKDKSGHPQNSSNSKAVFNKKLIGVGLLGFNQTFQYVHKKLERLTIAVHMVSSLFPESDPIRQTIRQESLTLLKDIFSVQTGDRDASLGMLVMAIHRMISLLNVAWEAGYMSDMNHAVLVREYKKAAETFHAHSDLLGAELRFPDDFFFIQDSSRVSQSSEQFPVVEKQKKEGKEKEHVMTARTAASFARPNTRPFARRHALRRDSILAVIREKRRVSVKDIAMVITDCSEKTLQRELLALVDENVLKKEGKRRWSVYSLAQ